MIEGGRLPGCSGMASRAIRPIFATVTIIGDMAGVTQSGGSLEFKVGMTLAAGDGCVLASQLEDGVDVIKAAGFPAACSMAICALTAKQVAVWVVLGVTGCAVSGRTDKEFVGMALVTGDSRMITRQQESRAVVVKRGWDPAIRSMATVTLCAEFTSVRLSFSMTCCATLGSADK